ncbi:MAG: hypothetical protein A3K61_01160 [Thaumarchaeota archaeon RBG_16_49_8]|nr:MAG: hypothetical protein A3K61_01160 [Thaumarchaeota archaeon RBG_16_49_8]
MFDLTFHMTTADKDVIKILKIDRALYGANDRTKTYRYYGRNPDWRDLSDEENQRNKKHLNGYTRIFPDGRRKIFTYQGVTKWNYTKSKPCRTCYGWDHWFSSGCKHEKYVCPECGRKQCLLHWPYPMKTEEEAIHFLKSAELKTDKKCFVRHVRIGGFEKWKIFTSEEDYMSYIKTRQHKR